MKYATKTLRIMHIYELIIQPAADFFDKWIRRYNKIRYICPLVVNVKRR